MTYVIQKCDQACYKGVSKDARDNAIRNKRRDKKLSYFLAGILNRIISIDSFSLEIIT